MQFSSTALATASGYLPLAKNRIELMNESFNARTTDYSSLLWVAGGIVACAALVGVAYLFFKRIASRRIASEEQLFVELSRAHKLNRKQTGLLRELARLSAISNPSVLFIDPAAWVLDPEVHGKYCRESERRRITVLKRILFEIDA